MAISCFGVGLHGGGQRPIHQIAVGKDQKVKIEALFDTGAESSLISSDVYDSLSGPSKPHLSQCPLGLTTADGGHMKIRGQCVVPLQIGSRRCWRPVVIVHGLHLPCIIGIDTMAAENISIDPINRKIKLGTLSKPTEGTNINVSRDYIIQANSVQNVGISLSSELRALRGVASLVTTGVHETLDVHPAVYEICNGFKIKISNVTNRDIYIRQGDRLATGEVYMAGSFDSVSAAINKEWIDQVQIKAGRVQKQLDREELAKQVARIPDEQKAVFANILSEHSDVFSIDKGDIGKCDIIQQKLTLMDKNKVCSTPPYRIPHHLLPVAHEYVDPLLSSDVIRPSKSPFSSPLMLVKKPGLKDSKTPIEEQYRVVHDYRKLNNLLIKDSYPMRNLFELIDEVGQGQIFSIIDLSQGFFCQTLTEDSKAYTAFGVPGKGHFEYNRSAQGLCNSPASFQRLLDFITAGLPGVFVYLDDVVIVSKTYQQHQGQLKQLLLRFRKYGIKRVDYQNYNLQRKK